MKFSEYCYGPLPDLLAELEGDNPPSDPQVIRVILCRCVREVIDLREALARNGGAA